jgi:arylsulfatase A-like enzyme
MIMRHYPFFITLLVLFIVTGTVSGRQPNIVVILTDDQGYADISLNPHHPKEVSTPNMDSLAKSGVAFRQGYISGSVCSPTRAGLMLGRYQQRVGVYTAGEGGTGFDPAIPIFPALLPKEYIKTALGKWHLGLDTDYPELKWSAVSRGFDEFYGFMGRGAHDYFKLSGQEKNEQKFIHPMYRGKERIDDEGYLTDRLSDEAVAFIDRNKSRPFFLYLAYNAVHAPAQAPKETLDEIKAAYPELSDERVVLTAMLRHLDNGIGRVVKKLKEEKIFEDTLLFFLTDNGGAKGMAANNAPLRGYKSSYYEGGIRTPFIVSYPQLFSGGRSIDTPVIALDILPTVLDALHVTPPKESAFDGKSLLPLLRNETTKHHETLYWSNGGKDGEWAVRDGDWKLHFLRGTSELFDLKADPSEKNDVAAAKPEIVNQLTKKYENWLAPMAEPISGAAKSWNKKEETGTESSPREQQRSERRNQKKSERRQDKNNANE